KGMEHMNSMMHGGETGASPLASPGGMPMEHDMGGGMSGGGMKGGANNSAQPQASPSVGERCGMQDDMWWTIGKLQGVVQISDATYCNRAGRRQFVDGAELVGQNRPEPNLRVRFASLAVMVHSGCASAAPRPNIEHMLATAQTASDHEAIA